MFLAFSAKFCINWPFFIFHTKKEGRKEVTVTSLKTCGAI